LSDGDQKVAARILPGDWKPGAGVKEFIGLPVFIDCVRGREPSEVRTLKTKREFLDVGLARAECLGQRRHLYFKAAADVRNFAVALGVVPNGSKSVMDSRECIDLLEAELTGEWTYLFDWDRSQKRTVRSRLEDLHDTVVGDSWRYSATFAMSNIVSLLDAVGGLDVEIPYEFCNLRNAQLINKPKFTRTRLRGIDFRGARVEGAVVCDTDFFGADFRGSKWKRTQVSGARLLGCQFDSEQNPTDLFPGALFDP
jgi:hypothetical protein